MWGQHSAVHREYGGEEKQNEYYKVALSKNILKGPKQFTYIFNSALFCINNCWVHAEQLEKWSKNLGVGADKIMYNSFFAETVLMNV